MKLTTRGFTLVELMIVIAIIGILAAALFPSLTSYLAKGRDTARASGVKEIITALSTYMVDSTGVPPTATNSRCADFATAVKPYLPKFPKDPVAGRTGTSSNCGTADWYGYGTGTADNQNSTAVSAIFEGGGGNTGAVAGYQGSPGAALTLIDSLTKSGSANGYVVRN